MLQKEVLKYIEKEKNPIIVNVSSDKVQEIELKLQQQAEKVIALEQEKEILQSQFQTRYDEMEAKFVEKLKEYEDKLDAEQVLNEGNVLFIIFYFSVIVFFFFLRIEKRLCFG